MNQEVSPIQAYKEAKTIYYFGKKDEIFTYNLEDGKRVRNALNKVKQRSKMSYTVKSRTINKNIIIWREHTT